MSDELLGWLQGAALFVAMAVLTAGAGYIIGRLLGRPHRPRWMVWACGAVGALLPPALLVGLAALGAVTYQRSGPGDPGDLPGLAFAGAVMVSPILFVLGLPFALGGVWLSERRRARPVPEPSRRTSDDE